MLFNVEVFKETIGGDADPDAAPVYRTGAEYYDVLGSADSLIAQIEVYSVASTPTTVTVAYEMSNSTDEETWMAAGGDFSATVLVSSFTSLPRSEAIGFATSGDFFPKAYGRFKITSTAPGASVRIFACGREGIL